jgi:Putative beta barrel porin-7 (BBP7)
MRSVALVLAVSVWSAHGVRAENSIDASSDAGALRLAAAQQPVNSPAAAPALATNNGCGAGGCQDKCEFWGSVEYLLWWTKGQHVPPLVTTSPPGTPITSAGVLGQPGTVVLYGGEPINIGLRQGGRFTLGYWLDDCHDMGISASYFQLEQSFEHFGINSTGIPILGRPFFDVTLPGQSAEITAFPGFAAGCLDVTAFQQFLGADLLFRKLICDDCGRRMEATVGYRYLMLRDGVTIDELVAGTGVANLGAAFSLTDVFRATNQFHGLDLGLTYEWRQGCWYAEAVGRVALGATFQRTTIQGATTIATAGQATTFPGGLLALESNIGVYHNTAFSVVPELRLNLGCQLCCNVRAFVGYDFLYWTNVARAGEQIDTRINPNLIPPSLGGPPALPAFLSRRNDFWAQGINFGLAVNY